MSIKYITDNGGIKTDVIISYDDWQTILDSHEDLKKQFDENDSVIADWQKEIVRNIIKTIPKEAYTDWEKIKKELDTEFL